MTKKEIMEIKMAIRLIHHEDKHYEGLNILAKLVGWNPFKLSDIQQADTRAISTRKAKNV